MAQAVQFTTHSAQRFQQRFGVRIQTGVGVDISKTFKAVGRAYNNKETGALTQAFVPKDSSMRLVMLVDLDTMSVITVMSSGPVVDSVYKQAFH
jgi:hypothetical protein